MFVIGTVYTVFGRATANTNYPYSICVFSPWVSQRLCLYGAFGEASENGNLLLLSCVRLVRAPLRIFKKMNGKIA